jgi:zinc protease
MLQSVGARVNATTWLDRTNYYAMLPVEHLPLAAEIEADRMRHARISDEDVTSERTVILNELDRGQNEPTRRLYQAVWSAAYVAHPYHHPTIGWRSDVENVTAAGLRGFYDTYYWPNNATVSVIGAVEAGASLDLVDRFFGQIPRSPEPFPSTVTREPEQDGERRVVVRMKGGLGAVMLAFKAPAGLEDQADALTLLATILGFGKTSRLYRRMVDSGLATHCSAGYPRFRDPGLFYVLAMLSNELDHETAERMIWEELSAVAREGVTEEELGRARFQYVAEEAYSRDGPFGIASQLNEAIAAGDWRLFTGIRARMAAVTPEAIQAAAARWLKQDAATVGWYVPRGE